MKAYRLWKQGRRKRRRKTMSSLSWIPAMYDINVFTLVYCITVIFLVVYCISFLNGEDESESASHWDNILNFVTVVVQ